MKRSQPHTCIHCDYTVNYEFPVHEAALELLKKWNATHGEDDQVEESDWDIFEEEAIEIVSQDDDVDTQCDECYDGYDY